MKTYVLIKFQTRNKSWLLLLTIFLLGQPEVNTLAFPGTILSSATAKTNSFKASIKKHLKKRRNRPKKNHSTQLPKNNDHNHTPVILSTSPQINVYNEYSTEAQTQKLDELRARAGVLRTSIVKQQVELQKLERQIECCSINVGKSNSINNDDSSIFDDDRPMIEIAHSVFQSTFNKFQSSTEVLTRKLNRVKSKTGPQNQKWTSVGEYVAYETAAGVRIVSKLVQNPDRLLQLVDPETPTLAPHLPAILARLDRLEDHVAPILERVLNNKRHLPAIEPYLDPILERFDDIEPHLPWILENIDALAPYTGLLLKHIDELLLYADVDEDEGALFKDGYDLASQLLPYLEYYVSRLDVIGPHLPLLRPHVPKLLQHNRIGKVSPHIDRLFALGYKDLSASANIDVLLFWFGWSLQVPGLPKLFFALPGSPKIVSFLANRLPKRFVRGYCNGVECYIDNDYGENWNNLSKGTL